MKILTVTQHIKELVPSLNANLNCPRTNNVRILGLSLRLKKTWGELIVNANALIMHSFFSVIQGND